MAFNNRNNLSNESAPWGREVEQKIESNTYNLDQLRLLTENNNKATNGTLGALTRQQQALAEQQQTLTDQQAQLVGQQQTLTEQQTQLQTAQQDLTDQQTQLNTTVDRLDLADAARKWQVRTGVPFSFSIPSGSADILQLLETRTITIPQNTLSVVSVGGNTTVNISGSSSTFSLTGNTTELRVYVNATPPQLEHVSARGLYLAGPPGSSASPSSGYQGYAEMYNRSYVPQMVTISNPETFTIRVYCYMARPVTSGSVSVSGKYSLLVESSPGTSADTF